MSSKHGCKRQQKLGGKHDLSPAKAQCLEDSPEVRKPQGRNSIPASQSVDGTQAQSMSADAVQDNKSTTKRLGRSFYNVRGEDLAKNLLGQRIVRMVDGVRLGATIVETEAYLGAIDKAAHSYKGQTDRSRAMFMQPGTAYVYNIYGMYCCLNISSQGDGCAVLIRSVEPVEGIHKMEELRRDKMKSPSTAKAFNVRQLGNGPAKLCQSLGITKVDLNQRDLVTDSESWLEAGEAINNSNIVVSKRINIAYAEEWTDKPLRFYVRANPFVSVRDKPAEKESQTASQYFP